MARYTSICLATSLNSNKLCIPSSEPPLGICYPCQKRNGNEQNPFISARITQARQWQNSYKTPLLLTLVNSAGVRLAERRTINHRFYFTNSPSCLKEKKFP